MNITKIKNISIQMLTLTAIATIFFVSSVNASNTGTLEGRVFDDDNGNFTNDLPTDSNGIEDANEKIFVGVPIYILDGQNIIQQAVSDVNGDWSIAVPADTPLTVLIKPVDINLPSNYEATTPTQHLLVEVSSNDTETVQSFGFGPDPE